LQIDRTANFQFSILNFQFAISAASRIARFLLRPSHFTTVGLILLTLALVCQLGCLAQKRAGPPSVLAKRFRPAPIPPGPNGLFMDVIHLERPFGDIELNRDLWATADEEQLEIALRAKLEQHGFRVAMLGGPMPAILKTLFSEEELGQMNGEHLQIQSGIPNQIQTGGVQASWPNETGGAENENAAAYANPVGMLRVIPRITSDGCVDLVVTPEIQHGDTRRQYVPNLGSGGPLDWSIQFGRQIRVFEDLTFTLRLRAGQYAMVGCLPADRESLGARFFSRSKDGLTYQRVILIQAEPSQEARAVRSAKP
jgi:hypothetical protein